ncbi:BQ2448_7306 [Microbotryum intermedium]|uniref:BQ2448_7306 protein n=1 Tax=Microbotryum intermedium TaxID=269621 RepID=A0A238FHT5_9BASI|nr:BQ2448_7306 [Microbotryum intermedium]
MPPGIPLRVLLDKRDRLLPETISEFYRLLASRTGAYHYHQSEVIWHAVSEATWLELEAYLEAFVERSKQRWDDIRRNWSYNIFSAEVREDWKDLFRSAYVEDPLVFQIEEWTGLCIHTVRKLYIEAYNENYRGVRPPLHLSDNLAVELLPYGGLHSWAEFRRAWFRGLGSSLANQSHPGHLSSDEIKHLGRKGVHFGLNPVISFRNVVDTRVECSKQVLGLPELLPDSNDFSKGDEHHALPRL